MNVNDAIVAARLEGVYGVMRKLQATHDGHESRCIGSGNCCTIGLRIHLSEAWNIAKQLRRQYWLKAEDLGLKKADIWWDGLIYSLKRVLQADVANWNPENEEDTTEKCVFYNGGCTIYEYRPMVCRSFGVISPAAEWCPRKRDSNGAHPIIRNDEVELTVEEFDKVIEHWGEAHPDLHFSIHIAAGVLRFLLTPDELRELIATTDQKFWMGLPGYPHQLGRKVFETPVELERKK